MHISLSLDHNHAHFMAKYSHTQNTPIPWMFLPFFSQTSVEFFLLDKAFMASQSLLPAFFLANVFLIFICKANVMDSSSSSTSPMHHSEKEGLYLVFQALAGMEWNITDLYPDPCGLSPITGASCDFHGGYWYVTSLDLGPIKDSSIECNSQAYIHPALFTFNHLQSLSFSTCFNSATQIFPRQGWKNLSSGMRSLAFENNKALIGELPSVLGELKNLESLVIKGNTMMEGRIPSKLGMLHNLRKLVLSGNGFHGGIPASLGNLGKNLLIMDLSFNTLDAQIPVSLGNLESILEIDLSNNKLRGSIPWEFGNLKNLTLLDIHNNMLGGILPRTLTEMSNLEELCLANNSIAGDISLNWNRLDKLRSLDLSNSAYEGSIPESLTELVAILFIALNDNKLSGQVPSKLAGLSYLDRLYLNGNNLSGQVVFPEDFYERMGRRLALWNNSGLCYVHGGRYVPEGIRPCWNPQAKRGPEKSRAYGAIEHYCAQFPLAAILVASIIVLCQAFGL